MAAAVNTEHKVTRQDTLRVTPSDIKRGRNSRIIPAPDYPDTVRRRAVSIAEQGQLQPCEVYRNEDKTLTLSLGNTRYDAVQLLRTGFYWDGKQYHNPNATLWVKVTDTTPDEAFLRGIKENLERKDTTDLQEALAQQELRTTLGWTDAMIARFYGYTNQNRVAALARLTCLPEAVQQKVHRGELALYAALDTVGLSDEQREQFLDGATGENGKINGATLRNLIRELQENQTAAPKIPETGSEDEEESAADEDAPKPKSIKRTVKDFNRFFEERAEDKAAIPDSAAELLKVLSLWFAGKRNDAFLEKTLNEACR